MMKRRTFLTGAISPIVLAACGGIRVEEAKRSPAQTDVVDKKSVSAAISRVVRHMDEHVSYRGGYVWAYLPDLTRSWGEMEAKRSMCWIQPPGTPTAAHAILDAYHATGDEAIYKAAERTCLALIAAQHPSGGWNYIHDFAGEESLKHWYETIGKNGWRLEEFQHYYGNATFDDAGTAAAAQFLLRMYLEKKDERFRGPLYKAIDFVIQAQYKGGMADGGWPQRWPHYSGAINRMPMPHGLPGTAGARAGMEDGDYTAFVTWNDDVAGENIKFLLLCIASLGETRLIDNVSRAMECMRRMQQAAPQAAWGLQHLAVETKGRPAGAPASARSYEPRALATHTTATNVQQLFNYFRLTGDKKFLARVPEALAWLDTCTLTEQMKAENPLIKSRTHATFIELGSNKPLFVHRYGSNATNGAYYSDYDHRDTPSHYSAGRTINTDMLRKTYDELVSMRDAAIAEMKASSPLYSKGVRSLPKYFSIREVDFPDLFEGGVMKTPAVSDATVAGLLKDLEGRNYWLTPIREATNPYRGDGPAKPYPGQDFVSTHVGDIYDTSPYDPLNPPKVDPYIKRERELGINTRDFAQNLGKLISWVAPIK